MAWLAAADGVDGVPAWRRHSFECLRCAVQFAPCEQEGVEPARNTQYFCPVCRRYVATYNPVGAQPGDRLLVRVRSLLRQWFRLEPRPPRPVRVLHGEITSRSMLGPEVH